MLVVELLVAVAIVLLVLFVATQVAYPMLKGSALCPMLRKDAQQVSRQLENARHATEVKQLEIELARERAKTQRLENELAAMSSTQTTANVPPVNTD